MTRLFRRTTAKRSLSKDKRGATSIEYGLICALITIGLVSAINSWGNSAEANFEKAERAFTP